MTWLLLLLVFAFCVLGSWASFTDRVRNGPHYVPVMIGVSLGTGLAFAVACQYLNSKPRIFAFSLYYDGCMAAAYYLLPLVFFGCRVHSSTVLAGVLIVSGILLLHWSDK